MSTFERLLKSEPALFTTFLNAAAALLAAFAFSSSQAEQAAIVVIGGALVTVFTGFLTRPVHVAVLAGAVTTGITAAAAFGLKLNAEDLALVATVLSTLSTLAVRTAPDVFALAHLPGRPVAPVPPA